MIVAPIGFQFTPLREGRRKAAQEIQRGGAISIHAPPRGATRWQEPNRVRTPFQFTPLREGRPMCGIRVRWRRRISIHAPPRGATKSMPGQSTRRRFQFTPLREGRPASLPSAPWWTLFQFTPLREGRQATAIITRERKEISIHAPPRGATVHRRSSRKPSGDFNSRPSARGDSPGRGYQLLINISIHAPPRGATAGCITVVAVSSNFNSRPSARGDRHSSNFA